MLTSVAMNDLLQLDADLQMLKAALANPNPTNDPNARIDAIHQKVLGLIAGETALTVQGLQARLQVANDTIRQMRQLQAQINPPSGT